MSISIVIAYHNRREQFLRTLKSIRYFGNPEVIVVDDASDEDQRLEDVSGITLIRIPKEDKKWVNTCIPYNMGLARAKGSVIIIQNAECTHTGDILSYCKKLERGTMFSFAAYSLDRDLPSGDKEIPILGLKPMIMKEPQRIQIAHHGWYNHSKHRPCAFHFCNAYLRDDLEVIGGFDERYAPGLAHEDDEIVVRTKRARIKIVIVDDPFVIHQKHRRTDYSQRTRGVYEMNKALYEGVTVPGLFIKPPSNNYYTRANNPATATHAPLIRLVLGLFKPKYVLELGIGWYSTPLFDNYVTYNEGCVYRGIENDKNWIADVKVGSPALDIVYHDLGDVTIRMMWDELSQYHKDLISEYYKGLVVSDDSPRLLFVDNYGSCRVVAFNSLKDKFDFIIIHDCELNGAHLYRYDELDTTGFRVYYLKNNLSWTALLIRDAVDVTGIEEAIAPLIGEHLIDYPPVEYMKFTQNYF